MPSHFGSIGFLVETEQQFQQLAEHAAVSGTVLPAPGGCYVRWSPGEGVELWVQADEQDRIVGCNPFFAGAARMKAGLVQRVARDGDGDFLLDGGFYGFASPHESEVGGDTPIVVDTPDAGRYDDLPLPVLAELAPVAFAHGLAAWPSESAFRTAQEEFKLSVGGLSALGLAGGQAPAHAEALAQWTGKVRAAAMLENPFSGGRFQWAHVEVPGGELDVVADPDLVDGEVVAGGVVAGTGWLIARIVRAL